MKRIGLLSLIITLLIVAQPIKAVINVDSLEQAILQTNKAIQEQRKDSIMFSKLTADQILELKKNELEVKQFEIQSEAQSDMPLSGFAIVVIVLIPFVFTALVLYIIFRTRNTESERRHALYLKSLEMGQAIPEHFFVAPKKDIISNLKKGIIWLAAGLGLVSFHIVEKNSDAVMVGIFCVFLGLGYLLVHFLEKPKQYDEQNG